MSYQDYMNLLFQYPCGCEVVPPAKTVAGVKRQFQYPCGCEVVQDDDGKDADLYPVFQYPCGCEVVR